jgi:hypothetical protein
MSQQFNVSPDNFRMAVDYIANFEDCCNQASRFDVAQIYAHRQTVETGAKLTALMLFSGAGCCHLFRIQLFFSFSTSSASTSFVSCCTGPRDFVRFDVGSFFFPELLCFQGRSPSPF